MTTHRIVSTLALLAALGSTLAHAQTGVLAHNEAPKPFV